VFVDELNKYAPAEGQETYVRKMLLDIAERGRYLGLVLFSAQQFRSQVHRRVVGNSGTALYGRMDGDELATPGYSVLSAATRTKLATLEKGQLMVRHPHFTQPIFIRFPRPAVLSGREGAERFPQAAEATIDSALYRSLRVLDPTITLAWVKNLAALYDEDELIKLRNAARLQKPASVRAFFEQRLRQVLASDAATSVTRPLVPPLKPLPVGDPYE
ncbi:MAG TPA: hypothetical protein VHM24_03065, partial [Gemmatimonadaceae bacterium]|nr:hypothetical protein [Gemmatimonadaceae bacterium]